MAQIQIRKAERVKSKLRLAISGPSGSGKTMGSLKLAKGIGGRVCLIDTERGSGDLYADLYDYDIISLEPPFKPDVLIESIRAAEDAGYDVIIIDSLSHFWADEGGLLDQVDKMQSAGKNRFTLWADITPQHRRLVNAMLNSSKHIVATMRAKQEYAMETDDKGRASVKKLGLAPVQREGMEYEFTVFFDVDQNHNAKASKDRTAMFNNEMFIINEDIGIRINKWLNTGRTDTRGLKREIVAIVRDRLELAPPADKADAADWYKMAIPKLTGGLEWSEGNVEAIATALREIKDKAWAYKQVWETPADKVDEKPSDSPQNSAPVTPDGQNESKVDSGPKTAGEATHASNNAGENDEDLPPMD